MNLFIVYLVALFDFEDFGLLLIRLSCLGFDSLKDPWESSRPCSEHFYGPHIGTTPMTRHPLKASVGIKSGSSLHATRGFSVLSFFSGDRQWAQHGDPYFLIVTSCCERRQLEHVRHSSERLCLLDAWPWFRIRIHSA